MLTPYTNFAISPWLPRRRRALCRPHEGLDRRRLRRRLEVTMTRRYELLCWAVFFYFPVWPLH